MKYAWRGILAVLAVGAQPAATTTTPVRCVLPDGQVIRCEVVMTTAPVNIIEVRPVLLSDGFEN